MAPRGARQVGAPATSTVDRDGDGILDKTDACPGGGGGGDGCPEADAPAAPEPARGLMGAPPPPPPPPQKPGDPQPAPDAKDKPTASSDTRNQQFLIYTAHLTMAVYQVEHGLSAVEKAARDVGGFLASRTDHEIVIRVPRSRFEETLKLVEQTGDVVHREVTAQDVTEEFMDVEVRLKNARAMRDKLEELLKKANVKESLDIERELGRITQEIERMEGRLKFLKDRIAYSTITVTFNARGSTVETRPLRLPFPWLQQMGLPTLLRLDEVK